VFDLPIESVSLYEYVDFEDTDFYFLHLKGKGCVGHNQRNYMLDVLSKNEYEYFYSVDDDNILHPKLIERIRWLLDGMTAIVVSQEFKDGTKRLSAAKENCRVCAIDTAQYILPISEIGDNRLELQYVGDGIFIENFCKSHPDTYFIDEPLSYYNYLRPMNTTISLSECPVPILQNEWEFQEFMKYYQLFSPKKVIEIGTFFGGTLWYWLKYAKLESIICVDYPIGESDDRYQTMIESRAKWSQWVEWTNGTRLHDIKGDSHAPNTIIEVYGYCPHKDVDMLFIDGDHSYQGVKADFFNYKSLVRPGGIIVFHDVVGLEDVKQFWNEIRYNYKSTEIYDVHGWGIGILFL
jgi:cephalosporin hydroxylase